jgi:hypothetical protein
LGEDFDAIAGKYGVERKILNHRFVKFFRRDVDFPIVIGNTLHPECGLRA